MHWLESLDTRYASLSDTEYLALLTSMQSVWEGASAEERLAHYRAVGARPPPMMRLPPLHAQRCLDATMPG